MLQLIVQVTCQSMSLNRRANGEVDVGDLTVDVSSSPGLLANLVRVKLVWLAS